MIAEPQHHPHAGRPPAATTSADAWGAHNVRTHGTGVKHVNHHIVGDLTLAYESLDLRAEPDLTRTVYTAEPGSPSEQALRLPASWAAAEEAVIF
jgi:hypothetical protein